MSLKLIRPGKRGNKVYYVRGTVAGQRIESSTGTTDKDAAEKFRAEFEHKLLAVSTKKVILTYGEASDQYTDDRKPEGWSAHMHRLIRDELAGKMLPEINQSEIVRVANLIYPKAAASTRNRWVVTPISCVMHYAARNRHCDWLRIERFVEEKPQTRAVSVAVARAVIRGSVKQERKAKLKQALCLWLFKHGNRISETLSVTGENVSFSDRTFQLLVAKPRRWKTFALDPEVAVALKRCYPDGLPAGRIFPWRTRWGVYKWLTPLSRALGIKFTPHMARHSVGTWYARKRAGLRATMDRLGHDDVESSMRYQEGDIEMVRQVNRQIGSLGGKIGGRHRKRKR